ncbi:MAG: hypothetical protein LM590_04070 [Thermofilum sp.]|jgi:hypothetical protein|nr:hypothetical protein [Thermofilum sp.]
MPLVLLSPKLRLARLSVAERLASLMEEFRGIFLPYPRELGKALNAYARGVLDWRGVFEEVKSLMPGFFRGWLWVEEPLIRSLRMLGKEVRCYGDASAQLLARSGKYLSLLLRARVSGRIDLEEWRRVLGEEKVPVAEGYVTVSSRRVEGAENIDSWGLPFPPTDDVDVVTREKVSEIVDYVFNFVVVAENLDAAYLKWLEVKKGIKRADLWELLGILGREGF